MKNVTCLRGGQTEKRFELDSSFHGIITYKTDYDGFPLDRLALHFNSGNVLSVDVKHCHNSRDRLSRYQTHLKPDSRVFNVEDSKKVNVISCYCGGHWFHVPSKVVIGHRDVSMSLSLRKRTRLYRYMDAWHLFALPIEKWPLPQDTEETLFDHDELTTDEVCTTV